MSEDRHQVGKSLLSEGEDSRGARRSLGDFGRKRLRAQLDSFDVSLFIYLVLCYSLL